LENLVQDHEKNIDSNLISKNKVKEKKKMDEELEVID